MMKPAIEESLKGYETDVVLYYKQFPLKGHPDSPYAARAALAANAQGKFHEMHEALFEDQHAHRPEDVRKLAEKLGLDMAKFDADYNAMEAKVEADRQEGVKLGVTGTPTLYINGIPYEGPSHPKYIKLWIDEALSKAR
jgi:protein-disulfide isomerase